MCCYNAHGHKLRFPTFEKAQFVTALGIAMKNPKTLVSDLCQQVSMTRFGIWCICRRYESVGLNALYDEPRSGRPREITALQRVSIEQLGCCEPSGVGLEMTHWSTRSLAEIAVKRGLVPHIAHSTVSLILRNADLQPHRSRYWITPTLNAEFLQRAGCILWLYERIEALKANDEIALALDEKPNIQALQRVRPTQPMRSGQIERQEFEYERHGVVNFLSYSTSTTDTCEVAAWTKPMVNTCAERCPACYNLFTHFDAFT